MHRDLAPSLYSALGQELSALRHLPRNPFVHSLLGHRHGDRLRHRALVGGITALTLISTLHELSSHLQSHVFYPVLTTLGVAGVLSVLATTLPQLSQDRRTHLQALLQASGLPPREQALGRWWAALRVPLEAWSLTMLVLAALTCCRGDGAEWAWVRGGVLLPPLWGVWGALGLWASARTTSAAAASCHAACMALLPYLLITQVAELGRPVLEALTVFYPPAQLPEIDTDRACFALLPTASAAFEACTDSAQTWPAQVGFVLLVTLSWWIWTRALLHAAASRLEEAPSGAATQPAQERCSLLARAHLALGRQLGRIGPRAEATALTPILVLTLLPVFGSLLLREPSIAAPGALAAWRGALIGAWLAGLSCALVLLGLGLFVQEALVGAPSATSTVLATHRSPGHPMGELPRLARACSLTDLRSRMLRIASSATRWAEANPLYRAQASTATSRGTRWPGGSRYTTALTLCFTAYAGLCWYSEPSAAPESMLQGFLGLACCFGFFESATAMADSLTTEHLRGTWVLIKASGLRAGEVLAGKMALGARGALACWLATALPLLGFSVLLGRPHLLVLSLLMLTAALAGAVTGLWHGSRSNLRRWTFAQLMLLLVVAPLLVRVFGSWLGTDRLLEGYFEVLERCIAWYFEPFKLSLELQGSAEIVHAILQRMAGIGLLAGALLTWTYQRLRRAL